MDKRSVAIVALTRGGLLATAKAAKAAKMLRRPVVAYAPEERLIEIGKEITSGVLSEARPITGGMGAVLPQLLREHGTVLAIMSLGIVVRAIGPHLSDKTTDGAVLVADEKLQNIIPVVGGHICGANELARALAGQLGARAVITTASDVLGRPAIDLMAAALGLTPDDDLTLRRAAAAIVSGRPIACYTDIEWLMPVLDDGFGGDIPVYHLNRLGAGHPSGGVLLPKGCIGCSEQSLVVTDRTDHDLPSGSFVFRPPTLVAGIGCRKGVDADAITAALMSTMDAHGLHPASIKTIASAMIKSEEGGLKAAAERLGRPLIFVDHEDIMAIEDRFSASERVRSRIGIGGVCEPAALIASGGDLLVKKQAHGPVTVAIARIGGNR